MPTFEFFTSAEWDFALLEKWGLPTNDQFPDMVRFYYPGCSDPAGFSEFLRANLPGVLAETEKAGDELKARAVPLLPSFFSQIAALTEQTWKYDGYACHLSFTFLVGGCYHLGRNTVSVFPRITHGDPLYALLHELFHLHFFDTLPAMAPGWKNTWPEMREKLPSGWSPWDLSEAAADLPLGRVELEGFAPMDSLRPEHKGLRRGLEPFWDLPYPEFMRRSVALLNTPAGPDSP